MTRLSGKDQTTLEDKYVLPRNSSERDRLQTQHRLFTEILGGKLIVDKTVMINQTGRVRFKLTHSIEPASWIFDPRESAPETAEFVAIRDVLIGPSVGVGLLSFEFVNQRLLIGAFTVEQWKMTLSGYFRVLKPGGIVQPIKAGLFESMHDSNSLPATKLDDGFCIARINGCG
ncbi:hypothetical protein ACEPAG_2749 [Sanghuangporus baumii]